MRRALQPGDGNSVSDGGESSRWALLPGLCCQAAGGDPHWADDVAAAWLLYYVAADLMDSVEDQDEPDGWWADLGPGFALNVASGLFFSASQALNRLYSHQETRAVAAMVIENFNNSFLKMCSGQHADLLQAEPTLQKYWETASGKSGVFFALACRTGACLVEKDETCLDSYAEFGHQLGLLIQILDDLEDFRSPDGTDALPAISSLTRSLPLAYALEVYPKEIRVRLREKLRASVQDPSAARETWDLIEDSGAGLYMLAEMERHRSQALAALQCANPLNPASEELASLIPQIEFQS